MLVLETHVDKHLASRSSAGRSLTSLLFAVLMLAPGPSAEADWLVMRDGSRLETQGSWEVRGTRIVLTLPGGMLASVAMREVDLERSHGESAPLPAAAKSPRVEGSLPVRKPAFVLTNRDVPSARNVAHRPDVRRAGGGSPGRVLGRVQSASDRWRRDPRDTAQSECRDRQALLGRRQDRRFPR